MTVNFGELTSQSLDEIKRPAPLPPGTYHGVIASPDGVGPAFEYDQSANKKTPFVRFHIKITSPGEDVDKDLLDGINLGEKPRNLRKDFYLTQDASWRLKDFLKSCDVNIAGRTIGEAVPDVIGHPVMVYVRQQSSSAPGRSGEIFNDVGDIQGA